MFDHDPDNLLVRFLVRPQVESDYKGGDSVAGHSPPARSCQPQLYWPVECQLSGSGTRADTVGERQDLHPRCIRHLIIRSPLATNYF